MAFVACTVGMESAPVPSSILSLKILMERTGVSTRVINISSHPVNLWELGNSWGFDTFSFLLRDPSTGTAIPLERRPQVWTRNVPRFYTLAPGEHRDERFDFADGTWIVPKEASRLKERNFNVRGTLTLKPSAEAEKLQVFVGSVDSDWMTSNPPHVWLFHETKPR